MKRVIIESPYAGDVARNLRYVRACMRDALLRGEAPFASHALYTQPGVLRDNVPQERELGIRAGFAWRAAAEVTAVYEDLGISRGMQLGIDDARDQGLAIEVRSVGDVSANTDGGSCRDCNCTSIRTRMARDPSGAEFPVAECVECEKLFILSPLAVDARDRALADAERAKRDLSAQLLHTERQRQSDRPPSPAPDDTPASIEQRARELVCEHYGAAGDPDAYLDAVSITGLQRMVAQAIDAGREHAAKLCDALAAEFVAAYEKESDPGRENDQRCIAGAFSQAAQLIRGGGEL